MNVPEKLSFTNVMSTYNELYNERSEWEAEWKTISDFILPGRGIYQNFSKPVKRKLTSSKVVNSLGEDSLNVLTSEIHGRLTSPARPWFRLEWADKRIQENLILKAWIEECSLLLHSALHLSNFYSIMDVFYQEYVGFGTGATYIGEDTGRDDIPFRFQPLTAGEYLFSIGVDGRVDQFLRTIFMTERQLYEKFKDNVSDKVKSDVKNNKAGIDTPKFAVLEYVVRELFTNEKEWTQVYYEVVTGSSSDKNKTRKPLQLKGFYECPYKVARWSIIGSDVYGIGPGSRALPDVKRLQEVEKSFLMAVHKVIDPPLNAPGRMKGKISSLPGAKNYYSNPQETVKELYQVRFDFQGVGAALERIEQRIKRCFYNDLFLTMNRDPNATPYKATEVTAREQEKLLRLGKVVDRLQYEFLSPLLSRCFNIMLRKGLFPPLDPGLAEIAGEYNIQLISPMAVAQRSTALEGINGFLAFIGQAAQYKQDVLDIVDVDEAAMDYAEINGVRQGIIRTPDQISKIRDDRAKALAAQRKKEEELAQAQIQADLELKQAQARKAQADASEGMTTSQQTSQEMGLM